jgi:hypothetical protein
VTIQRYTQTIPANGLVEIPSGNFFLLVAASGGSVEVAITQGGTRERFPGAIGGLYVKRVNGWDLIQITGAAGVVIEYWHGSENVDRDETDIRLATSVIAGSVSINELPAGNITDTAPVVCGPGAQTPLIAANAARKRVRFSIDSANVDGGTTASHAYIRKAGGAQNLQEAVPGFEYEFKNTSGFDLRNDSAGNYTVYIFEEF